MAETDLTLIPYSERSFVVFGEDTRAYKSKLQELGGRYNPNLTDPESGQKLKGWIFSKKQQDKVEQLIEDIKNGAVEPDVAEEAPVRKTYTKKVSPKKVPAKAVKSPSAKGALKLATPVKKLEEQTVTYTLVKPRVGLRVTLRTPDGVSEGEVFEIGKTDNVVDTAFMHPLAENDKLDTETIYQLVITNGKWKILGVIEEHTVEFSP